jgi:hypothetical protein
VFIPSIMYLIAECLCSVGWHEALRMIKSVVVGFLYYVECECVVGVLE